MQQHIIELRFGVERHLERDRCCVTRVLRPVAMRRDVGRVRRYYQSILSTLQPDLIGAVGQSDVNQSRREVYKPMKSQLKFQREMDHAHGALLDGRRIVETSVESRR